MPDSVPNPSHAYSEDPISIAYRVADKIRTVWLSRTYPFASFGQRCWVNYKCQISRSAAPFISVGDDVGMGRDVRLAVCARASSKPVIQIDKGCWLQRRTTILGRNSVRLMPYVMCAHSVLISDHNPDSADGNIGGTVRVEENCWIGYGVSIISEAGELVIGRHSVIAANCVITSSVPPYSVIAGNPPKIVKQYDIEQRKWVIGCVRRVTG
jgi:acetyltransferase-like isoleucine patch superfamily enzyme